MEKENANILFTMSRRPVISSFLFQGHGQELFLSPAISIPRTLFCPTVVLEMGAKQQWDCEEELAQAITLKRTR